MPKLTKPVIHDLLNNNDGFTRRTSFASRDRRGERTYMISGGKLFVNESICNKNPEDSYDNDQEATDEEIRRFLYMNRGEMIIVGSCL